MRDSMNDGSIHFVAGLKRGLLIACTLLAFSAPAQLMLKLSVLDVPVTQPANRESSSAGVASANVALGTPIALRIELINQGTNAVTLLPSVDPAASLVSLFMGTPAGGTPSRFTTTRWETRDYLIKPRSLAPGAKLVHETFLFGRLDIGRDNDARNLGYMFSSPGKYTLYATYNCPNPDVSLLSNTVFFEVGPPIEHWSSLQSAGIVPLIEGRLPTAVEVANKTDAILKLLESDPTNSCRAWLEQKARNDSKH